MNSLLENVIKIFTCIFTQCVNCFYMLFFCFGKNKCEICNCRFKSKQCLATHIKTNHPEIFAWGSSIKFKKSIR